MSKEAQELKHILTEWEKKTPEKIQWTPLLERIRRFLDTGDPEKDEVLKLFGKIQRTHPLGGANPREKRETYLSGLKLPEEFNYCPIMNFVALGKEAYAYVKGNRVVTKLYGKNHEIFSHGPPFLYNPQTGQYRQGSTQGTLTGNATIILWDPENKEPKEPSSTKKFQGEITTTKHFQIAESIVIQLSDANSSRGSFNGIAANKELRGFSGKIVIPPLVGFDIRSFMVQGTITARNDSLLNWEVGNVTILIPKGVAVKPLTKNGSITSKHLAIQNLEGKKVYHVHGSSNWDHIMLVTCNYMGKITLEPV